jgi:hypothetical protein
VNPTAASDIRGSRLARLLDFEDLSSFIKGLRAGQGFRMKLIQKSAVKSLSLLEIGSQRSPFIHSSTMSIFLIVDFEINLSSEMHE